MEELKTIRFPDIDKTYEVPTKSEVANLTASKADAIIKSASGEVASFSDGGNLPCKSLTAQIVPKQSGSGDPSPSNVRPISGYESVNVKRIGKNILAYDRANGSYVSGGLTYTITDGHINVNGTSTSNYPTLIVANPLPLKAGTYTISKTVNGTVPSGAYLYIIVENSGLPNAPSVRSGNSFTFTLTEDRDVRIVLCAETSGKTWNNVGVDFQIERGSTATTYEPYQGNTYPISLGQTVYGGTLEVMSGKLTVDKMRIDLGTGGGDFFKITTDGHASFYCNLSGGSQSSTFYGLCSQYAMTTNGNLPNDNTCRVYGSTLWGGFSRCIIRDDSKANLTAEEFKTAMNGVQLVYELATPTEITLTPTQVKTLLGNNNIWANSGSVEVEYRADTTLAYNELLSLIASLS